MTRKNSATNNPSSDIKNLVAIRIQSKINDLKKEISQRRNIENECLDSLRQENRATIITLNEILKWTLGSDPTIERRRLELENRLCLIRKQIRDHRVSFWQDIQTLRREAREVKDILLAVTESDKNGPKRNKCDRKTD